MCGGVRENVLFLLSFCPPRVAWRWRESHTHTPTSGALVVPANGTSLQTRQSTVGQQNCQCRVTSSRFSPLDTHSKKKKKRKKDRLNTLIFDCQILDDFFLQRVFLFVGCRWFPFSSPLQQSGKLTHFWYFSCPNPRAIRFFSSSSPTIKKRAELKRTTCFSRNLVFFFYSQKNMAKLSLSFRERKP